MNFEIAASMMGMEIIMFVIGITTMFIIVIGCFWLYFSSKKIVKRMNENKEKNDVDYLAESLHHIFKEKRNK